MENPYIMNQNVEDNSTKNKKGGGLTKVIIILLLLLVLGLGGYIVYDKVIVKDNNSKKADNTEKTEEKVQPLESIDATSDGVLSLYNSIDIFNSVWWLGKSYGGYLYRQDSLSVSSMPDDVKVIVGIENALKECGDACKTTEESGGTKLTVDASKVEAQIKKIFGSIKYENTNTKDFHRCSKDGYTFENGVYSTVLHGCGIVGAASEIQTKIVKAEKNDKELNIYTNFLVADPNISATNSDKCVAWDEVDCLIDIALYKDYNKTSLIERTTDNIYGNNGISEETMTKYHDKLDTYKLHFEKEDGEYHFKEIVKQ